MVPISTPLAWLLTSCWRAGPPHRGEPARRPSRDRRRAGHDLPADPAGAGGAGDALPRKHPQPTTECGGVDSPARSGAAPSGGITPTAIFAAAARSRSPATAAAPSRSLALLVLAGFAAWRANHGTSAADQGATLPWGLPSAFGVLPFESRSRTPPNPPGRRNGDGPNKASADGGSSVRLAKLGVRAARKNRARSGEVAFCGCDGGRELGKVTTGSA